MSKISSWKNDGNEYSNAHSFSFLGRLFDRVDLIKPVLFLIIGLFLCHVTLKLAQTSVANSRPSVP